MLPATAIFHSSLPVLLQQCNQSTLQPLIAGMHEIWCLEPPYYISKIDSAACRNIIPTICTSLTGNDPLRGQWLWATTPGCALDYYLNVYTTTSRIPTTTRCKERIYGEIIRLCASRSPPKIRWVDVRLLPKAHTRSAFNEGFARYILVGESIGCNAL